MNKHLTRVVCRAQLVEMRKIESSLREAENHGMFIAFTRSRESLSRDRAERAAYLRTEMLSFRRNFFHWFLSG